MTGAVSTNNSWMTCPRPLPSICSADTVVIQNTSVNGTEYSEHWWEKAQVSLALIVNGPTTLTLVVLGVTLNLISIAVFVRPLFSRHKIPMINYYLVVVAAWDCALLAMGALLLYCMPTLLFGQMTQFAGGYSGVFPMAFYVSQTCLSGSVWIMLALSFDRYLAFVYPLKHKLINPELVPRVLVIISLFAMIFNIPEFFRLEVNYCFDYNMTSCVANILSQFIMESQFSSTEAYSFWYRIVGGMLTYSLLPFIVLIILTIRIAWQLTEASKSRRTMTHHKPAQAQPSASDNHTKSRLSELRRASATPTCSGGGPVSSTTDSSGSGLLSAPSASQDRRCSQISISQTSSIPAPPRSSFNRALRSNQMHAAVIVKFVVCRSMCAALDILEKLDKRSFDSSSFMASLVHLSNLLVVINSASSFFVYFYFSHKFRSSLWQIRPSSCKKHRPVSRSNTLSLDAMPLGHRPRAHTHTDGRNTARPPIRASLMVHERRAGKDSNQTCTTPNSHKHPQYLTVPALHPKTVRRSDKCRNMNSPQDSPQGTCTKNKSLTMVNNTKTDE